MAKKFSDLVAHRSPESQAHVEALIKKLRAEMPLHRLRQAQALSQDTLAKLLHVNQVAITKMERRTGNYRDLSRGAGQD